MKAARLHDGETTLRIDEVDVPRPGPGEVRVAMTRAFVAPFLGSLVDGTGGFTMPERPFSPGLDGIGRVDAVGAGVEGLQPRQRVYCDNYYRSTRIGAPANHSFIGNFMLGADSAAMLSRWPAGALTEMAVLPDECLIPISDDVTTDDGVLTRLGWLGTAYGAFKKVGLHAGQDVAVLGATGIVGSSAVMVALALGARRVYALGRRQAVLDELAALDPRIHAATEMPEGARVDVALSCIDGDGAGPIERRMTHLRRNGVLVLVATTGEPMALSIGFLLSNDITVRGSLWFERSDIAELIAMIGSGVLDLSPVRLQEFPLAEVDRALEAVAARPSGLEQVILHCGS